MEFKYELVVFLVNFQVRPPIANNSGMLSNHAGRLTVSLKDHRAITSWFHAVTNRLCTQEDSGQTHELQRAGTNEKSRDSAKGFVPID